jgi:hypothetical protein
MIPNGFPRKIKPINPRRLDMAKAKGIYDGFQFDFPVPQDRPVTGKEIKDGMAEALGHDIEGAPAIRRSNGEFEHVGANDHVQVQQGDSFTVARPFETAGDGSPTLRVWDARLSERLRKLMIPNGFPRKIKQINPRKLDMDKAKGIYDGFQFDFDVPLFGHWPPGDLPKPRPIGELDPVGPVEPEDSYTVAMPFEMAVTGRPTRRV